MSGKTGSKTVMVLVVAAVLALGTYAFADWGRGPQGRGYGHMMGGYGHHMMGDYDEGYGPGYGRGMGRGYGRGPEGCPGWSESRGYGPGRSDLSREQLDQMDKERESFFSATESLRKDIDDKEQALSEELRKESPNMESARMIQKELSALQSQFDEKRLEHMMTMRKIAPDAGRGYAGGYHGRQGYGPCWGN